MEAGVTAYLTAIYQLCDPLPKLAGQLAVIVIKHQAELEDALVTFKIVGTEMKAVLDEHVKSLDPKNKELAKLIGIANEQLKKLISVAS